MRLISKPVLCNYYVTYRCNAACGFCDIWEKPSPYVKVENARKNFTDLKKLGVKVIDFTGGEPLLHREIDLLLEEAKKLKFITTITTNTLLYPKWAERLKGKVDMLHFSLDSPNKEEHDASRKVACFDFFVESLQIAKSIGERPDIMFTVFEHNIDQIEEVYQKFSVPYNYVLILNPVFEYNDLGKSEKLTAASLKKLKAWGKRKNVYLNDAFIQLREDGGNKTEDPICKAASSTIVISPENKLMLPCYHLGIESFEIKDKLYDLYRSPKIKDIIHMEGKYKGCEGCTINCYMQPSFAVELNKYWLKALPSTLKYNWIKGTWKQLMT
jgi:MoaA/NifB/PqqE/SkfB family radical SAM enzyme